MDRVPEHSPAPFRRSHLLIALGLLVAAAALHLWYLIDHCPLDLSGDEAHYWEWSRRLDWSYYSKGPLVAYIIAAGRALLAGWSQRMVGSEALAVRVPAIVLSMGTALGVYALAVQTLRSSRLALAAIAVTFTIPIFAVGAILMTIDAPLAFCFIWTLVACTRGLERNQTWPWLVAGVLIALGILAKYTMVLVFPVVGLALLTEPSYRRQLRRPGPYLATLIGALGFVPILIWNAQHDWVSFRHVAGQAGVSHGPALDVLGPLAMLAGQAAVVGPVWFLSMLCAAVTFWRDPRPRPAAQRLLLYATLTPWVVFGAFSFITKVQPNWPVLALLPGVILLVAWLARLLGSPLRRLGRTIIVVGVVLGSVSVLVMHRTDRLMPVFAWLARGEPPWILTPVAKYDPASRLRGWSQLGAAVGRELEAERAAGRDPFIITDDYQVASQIAFYCPGRPNVYCLQAVLGDRQSQYDLWPNPIRDPERFVGRPCIYVGARKPELFGGESFSLIALPDARLAETVEYRVDGYLIQVWPIFVCPAYAGLPPELAQPTGRY